jgi:hypothetical protein
MKVVTVVTLLFLFSTSPLVFFLSSFSVSSFVFAVVDGGCVVNCRWQTMIRGEERFFLPYLVFVSSSIFFSKIFLFSLNSLFCSSHLSLFFMSFLSSFSLFLPLFLLISLPWYL